MRIKIKADNKNINIPIPMCFVTTGIRVATFVGKRSAKRALIEGCECNAEGEKVQVDVNDEGKAKEVKKKNNNDYLKYIDMIDSKALIEAMKELKKYKGLNLVEVHSSTGEHVLIKI